MNAHWAGRAAPSAVFDGRRPLSRRHREVAATMHHPSEGRAVFCGPTRSMSILGLGELCQQLIPDLFGIHSVVVGP